MNTRDADGHTALDLTWTIGGHPDVALLLLADGAQFSQSNMSAFVSLILEDSGAELHLCVCKALLLSGNHGRLSIPAGDMDMLSERLRALSSYEEFSEWLYGYLFSPLNLRDICRIVTRKDLMRSARCTSIRGSLLKLPLPRDLQNFLLLDDMRDACAQETSMPPESENSSDSSFSCNSTQED